MSGQVMNTSVNRRTVLKRLAAGTALASGGCTVLDEPGQETSSPGQSVVRDHKPDSQPAEPREPAMPKPALTRRLFSIDLMMAAQIQDQLASTIKSHGGVASPVQLSTNAQELRRFAWIEPKTAVELVKNPSVLRVERVKPGEPTDSTISPLRGQITTPPEKGRRQFFVVLGPNSWPASVDAKGFHSTENIAKFWAQQWKTQADVEVEVVKAEKWSVINSAGVHIGATPGQIRVSIPGEKVPADVLKSIQSHPQVLRLQWDHGDVIYNCPPCGMG
jgi:hypothetical protein